MTFIELSTLIDTEREDLRLMIILPEFEQYLKIYTTLYNLV